MKRPKIGVLPLYDNKNEMKWNTIWMHPGYLDGILAAGGMPSLLPLLSELEDIKAVARDYDGFLFTGGQDVSPSLYGEPVSAWCNHLAPERDRLETLLFKECLAQDIPVFGVCRGFQLFNVVLGGTLYQDMRRQRREAMPLQHDQKTDFTVPIHEIFIEDGTRLHQVIGEDAIWVNSMHHQGLAKVADDFIVSARSADGLAEAAEIRGLSYGLAIQWHPEFLWPHRSYELDLWKDFVKAAAHE